MASTDTEPGRKPVTLATLRDMKARGEKIAALTAYDAGLAALVDEAGTDLVLVGDSLGMVVQGRRTTVPVTIADIVYHTSLVERGLSRAFLVADLPFLSFATPEMALASAARVMQEGGAQMVKMEVHSAQAGIVEALANADVPVCAHIGLRPQAVHRLGGYRVQGKSEAASDALLADATAMEAAGADMLLIECTSATAAARITAECTLPVIGIGAGTDVDGQILVLYDVLGITRGPLPRFSKDFTGGAASPLAAIKAYVAAVRDGSYPAREHIFA